MWTPIVLADLSYGLNSLKGVIYLEVNGTK